nr:hypothetical protein [uncultured Methanoregula sp.]
MKIQTIITSFILVLMMASAVSAADSTSSTTSSSTSSTSSTSDTSTTVDAAAQVCVTNVTMDPEVIYPYEEGTISVTLTNSGTTAVGLSHPDLLSDKIHIKTLDSWDTMSYIGAGASMTYSFVVTADPPDGTDYALFTVGTKAGTSIHYPIKIKVDSRDIQASLTGKPTTFSQGEDETVNLTLINVRSGTLKNILVTPTGNGIEVQPSQKYVYSLSGHNSVDVPFTVKASQDSNLTFRVSYMNGDAEHTVDLSTPVILDHDTTSVVPVINNLALTSKGSYYDLTGDIINSGVSDAKGLLVTVGSPAKGTETYPEYAIGSLASDDSGSFELTFTSSDLSSVPLIISWKNSDGKLYKTTKTLDLTSSLGALGSSASGTGTTSGSSGNPGMMQGGPQGMGGPGGQSTSLFSSKGNGISSFYPVIAAGIILVVGIVLYKKRKWLSTKLKKQQ